MKSLVGEFFDHLEVKRFLETKNGNRIWECECDCGKLTTASTGKLNYGHKTSCGCQKYNRALKLKKFGKQHHAWSGCGDLSGSIWNRIKKCAEKRNKEFLISIEEAWNLFCAQHGKCAITGVDIYLAKTSKELTQGSNTASLDRIDSKLGYIKDNVQWVHTIINQMKWDLSQDNFIQWCHKVVNKEVA